MVVITLHHSANKFHNVFHLLIFASGGACAAVDTRNVDDGLAMGVQHLADMVEIYTLIEVITQHKILQILVAIELLIVVVAYGIEACLVLCTKHRNTIATEIAACHGYNMPGRVVHHTADCIAQSAVCISTGMVKLVNSQQTVVPVLIIQFLHGIAQCGMGTHQHLRFCFFAHELTKASSLVAFIASGGTQVVIRC